MLAKTQTCLIVALTLGLGSGCTQREVRSTSSNAAPPDDAPPSSSDTAATDPSKPDAAVPRAPTTSSSATGKASYQTNLASASVDVKDSFVSVYLTPNYFTVLIHLSEEVGTCANYKRNERPEGLHEVLLYVTSDVTVTFEGQEPSKSPPNTDWKTALSVGTHLISDLGPPLYTIAPLTWRADPDPETNICRAEELLTETISDKQAITNELVITAVDDAHITGAFELRYASGEYFRGSFDAPICEIGGLLPNEASLTCVSK